MCIVIKRGEKKAWGCLLKWRFSLLQWNGVHDFSHYLLRQSLLLWDNHRGYTWSSGRWGTQCSPESPDMLSLLCIWPVLACHLDTVVPWSPQWSSCWYSVHSSSPEWCGTAAECMPSFCSRCTVVFAVLPETDPAHSAARLTTPCTHCSLSYYSLHTVQPLLPLPAHTPLFAVTKQFLWE